MYKPNLDTPPPAEPFVPHARFDAGSDSLVVNLLSCECVLTYSPLPGLKFSYESWMGHRTGGLARLEIPHASVLCRLLRLPPPAEIAKTVDTVIRLLMGVAVLQPAEPEPAPKAVVATSDAGYRTLTLPKEKGRFETPFDLLMETIALTLAEHELLKDEVFRDDGSDKLKGAYIHAATLLADLQKLGRTLHRNYIRRED